MSAPSSILGLRLRIPHVVMPLLVLATAACYRPATEARPHGSWSYEVDPPTGGARVVAVEATFDGVHTERLGIPQDAAPYVHDMKVRDGDSWRAVERRGDEWFERSCNFRCTVSYNVDLGALAAGCGDEVDCARRVGPSTLSPALSWLVHPVPRTDVPVTVRVHPTDASQFASGMSAAEPDTGGTTYSFRAFDLDEGSFTAFGPMRRTSIEVPGSGGSKGRLDVAVLGTSYAMPDAEIREWVRDAANATVPLFGRFPVDRATLFVVPARGQDEVVFGKVLSLAGASVVVVVGDKMPATSRHRDWVLVHELFHLGFPTFRGEGRWLGEGLATYYEPILRARAGWTSEADVFRQFARNMPRGQPAPGTAMKGLSARDDLDAIYWGGATFCLAADVRIREETHGAHSLDDVIRAALARGGDATHVWTVKDVISLGDNVTGTNVLSEMYERYARSGERIDLDGLLASLGVPRDGHEGDDTKPLAWIRRQIAEPAGRDALAQSP